MQNNYKKAAVIFGFIVIVAGAYLIFSRPAGTSSPALGTDSSGTTTPDATVTSSGNTAGAGQPTPAQPGMTTYSSNTLGLGFQYPKAYSLGGTASAPTFSSSEKVYTYPQSVITVTRVAKNNLAYKQVLMSSVTYDATGMLPKAFSEFSKQQFGANTFYRIQNGLFEGVLTVTYFLVSPRGIYEFQVHSLGVDWTNPKFNLEKQPGVIALKQILPTAWVK